MNLSADQIVDLVTTTQNELGRMKWTDIATNLTEYEVLPKMLKQDKVVFDGGKGITRNAMVTDSGAAKHVGLFAVDDVNVGDVMKTFTVPWRHTTTSYAFDRREEAMNSGAQAIVDLIKVRRADAMISLAKLLESTFWGKPATSADTTTPYGLDYWIVYSATTGFNGGNPTGFSDGCGGLDSTTYTRWRNYTAQYTDVTKADLIAKMRTAHRKTDFKSPVDIPDYRTGKGQSFRIYMNETTIAAMETLGEGQNENLGRDLAAMDGTLTFRKNPLIYIPQLDDDTGNPVYMVNWNAFFLAFLRGEYLREEKPTKASKQHTVFEVFVDLTWNTVCVDRRRQALIAKSTNQ